jgi:hypothetical protein
LVLYNDETGYEAAKLSGRKRQNFLAKGMNANYPKGLPFPTKRFAT